ncbi:MAG: hypothetical protein J7J10_02760 [Deltaproteobacteria bacterium]|nr:hypothetical protein [Deltaproteobacteria bacterium]
MKKILEKYNNKLSELTSTLKTDYSIQIIPEKDVLEDLKKKLEDWGKSNLQSMLTDLTNFVEKNCKEYITKNKQEWENIKRRAKIASEYGLYLAPIDLINVERSGIKATAVGSTVVLSNIFLSRLIRKKLLDFSSSLIVGGIIGFVSYLLFKEKEEMGTGTLIEGYINDSKEWISTALENVFSVFEEIEERSKSL